MPLRLSLPPPASPNGTREPILEPEAMSAWLASLAATDPIDAARCLVDQLASLNARRIRITLRQELSELIYAVTQKILPALEYKLGLASIPLTAEAHNVASLAGDLIDQLSASYKILLLEQARRLFGFASSGRARLPVVRIMALLSRRLALGYRTYSTAHKGTWTELHELHQFAARRGLTRHDPANQHQSPHSALDLPAIETIYKHALLLAFSDPLRLMPGDVHAVEAVLNEHAERALLSATQERRSSHGVFVITPRRDAPGYAVSKHRYSQSNSGELLLNALPVAEALQEKVAKLASGSSAVDVGLPQVLDPSRVRDLMTRLVKHWGAMPNRRFNRLRTHARVEVCIGIADIWTFLNEASTDHCVTGEWVVTNESPRGFALKHVSGAMGSVKVGEVIGLRTRASRNCHVCVVRWILSDHPEHLELGLEELAPTARAASVRKLRDNTEMSAPQALLLPEVPSQNQPAALLAPLMMLDSTCELSVGELQAKFRVRPTRLVERTSSVQMLQFSSAM